MIFTKPISSPTQTQFQLKLQNMKTKLLFVALLTALGVSAQVGVGTVSPNAQLDVRATSQAAPTNTDGMLIPKVDVFPAVNPTAAQQAMLVYLTTAVGPKTPGFYYWDFPTLSWIGITSSISSDKDWLETGTALAPDDITDDMYHMGRAAIGKITPTAPLDVVGGNGTATTINNTAAYGDNLGSERMGILNSVSGSSTDTTSGIRQFISGTGTGARAGVYQELGGSTSGQQNGVMNILSNTGNGLHIGTFSSLSGSGTNGHYGAFNTLTGTGTGAQYGVYNSIANTGGGNHFGSYNTLSGTGNGNQFGAYSIVSTTGLGDLYGNYTQVNGTANGAHYGTFNDLTTAGTAIGYGTYNFLRNITSSATQYANYNSITGTGSGQQYGNWTIISNSGNAEHYGSMNGLTGTGSGNHYGSFNSVSGGTGLNYGTYNSVTSTGNGSQTGTNNVINGSGTGQKIGTYNYIDPTAGGTHYGVVSYALKAGSYAGYFQGAVAIGTNVGNPYILPASRGLNTQIMQTDGAGNVTWQNPGTALNSVSWLTTGNSGLVSGTNFLGTTDNISVAFRTSNLERMRLLNDGRFVINAVTPVTGDVFSTYATGGNYAINGYSNGTGAAGYFINSSTGSGIVSGKTGTSGSAGIFQTLTAANTTSTVDIYNQTGVAPALAVRTDAANVNADGIEVNVYGAAAKRGLEMYLDTAVTGIGIGVFHNGTNRGLNVQQQNTTNVQPAIFASVASNARVLNAQSAFTTNTTQIGFFAQGSTGLTVPAYDAASAVWGQTNGIRGGTFLAAGANFNTTALEGSYSGVLGNYDGIGVYGSFAPAVNYGYGVVGEGNWYGMYAVGDSGASGVKAFQIDHPLDPENKYLRHYSMESPEVLNMYRGNVILDANGEATVILPSYFDAININFSYHLTAIGAPANPYIKEEIQGNEFKIAGGNANQKISWQVFAERNDAYLQQNPEKKKPEVDKKQHDRGLYIQPELYNQPKDKGIFKRYKADPAKGKLESAERESPSKPAEAIQLKTQSAQESETK